MYILFTFPGTHLDKSWPSLELYICTMIQSFCDVAKGNDDDFDDGFIHSYHPNSDFLSFDEIFQLENPSNRCKHHSRSIKVSFPKCS